MIRGLTAAALALGGAVFGALMTFGHQARLTVAGAEIPWGLAVAVLGVTALLVGTRLTTEGRRATVWVAAGLVGAAFVLALPGPGGSVLVPNGVPGMIWALAPSFIAILVVLWPAPRPKPTPAVDRLGPVERTSS